MLQHMARRGRLEAMLHDQSFDSFSKISGELAQIIQPDILSKSPLVPLTGLEAGRFLAKGPIIASDIYDMLLAYLHSIGQIEWKSHKHMPHLDDELALLPRGRKPSDFKFDGHTFSSQNIS